MVTYVIIIEQLLNHRCYDYTLCYMVGIAKSDCWQLICDTYTSTKYAVRTLLYTWHSFIMFMFHFVTYAV